VNPDGGVGIKVSGITYSSEPSWVTSSPLGNQAADIAFNVTLSATGASSYSVAAGSTLPAGTTLAANGYFSGTVSIGAETTYTFSVVATDAENQDSSKTFQVTVTVTPQGRLYGFGGNSDGRLGLNDQTPRSSPVQVGTGADWTNVKLGGTKHALALKSDGTLWAWGAGGFGELGTNDITYRNSPTQIGTNTNWSKIAAGSLFSLAIKTDGTLWGWGAENNLGAAPGGGFGRRSSPVQVGADNTWSSIDTVSNTAFATKTNGTLWSWGYNDYGQLGLNTRAASYISSPTQVGTDTNWLLVRGTSAIKTTGTLWTWGQNLYGQLGQNDTVHRSSPTQVGAGTNWSSVDCGAAPVAAVKTDGTLWNWGLFTALNDGVYKSSPTQVGAGTNWSTVLNARNGVGAVTKTDGTLWIWGLGNSGMLGQNNTDNKSSPVQLGSGTDWVAVTVSQLSTLVIG
jgi:alpha-tubulin suppressor-like RCC1 family protein